MTWRPKLCTGCGLCIDACPAHVIGWDDEEERPIVCIFCGRCAQYCPHGCLELVDVPDVVPAEGSHA